MPKSFSNTFGVILRWCGSEKKDVEDPKLPEGMHEAKSISELGYVVDTPDKSCPPGYKRDKYDFRKFLFGTGGGRGRNVYRDVKIYRLMPTQRNRQHHRDCPICFQHLTQPIQCIKGHQICAECRDKARECILCSETHCSYSRLGCTAEGSVAGMKKHEAVCFYRSIRCAYHLQCGKHEISLSEYKRHLEDVHRPYIKKIRLNDEDEIVLKTDPHSMVRTGNILRIEGTDVYFVRRCLLDLQEDVLLICLHLIGENDEAKNYIYRISLNQGIHHAKYMCTSYCLPYFENSNSCATLSNCNLLRPSKVFLNKDYLQEIHYSMTIKRV